jgi:hypothetical protein
VQEYGGLGCQDFGGYHQAVAFEDAGLVFCVVPGCTQPATSWGLASVADLGEFSLSHEIIEAATDPLGLLYEPAYVLTDVSSPWTVYIGGNSEVGDLCVDSPPYSWGNGFYAQRIWSNSLAQANAGSPCAPVPEGEVFYNVSLSPDTTVYLNHSSQSQDVTFQITGWSTAPIADWYIYVARSGGTFTPGHKLSGRTGDVPTTLFMNNGESATLTLTVPANTPSGSWIGVFVGSYSGPSEPTWLFNYFPAAIYVK